MVSLTFNHRGLRVFHRDTWSFYSFFYDEKKEFVVHPLNAAQASAQNISLTFPEITKLYLKTEQ
ncbi:hypothetical protein D1614_23180 [Maribellus luteus]|uniref:Uncharacterized protein n=1 Tax=Maribellus luteus TaxID=2305463 RepID=A0A399SPY4_9BACT|nr:hypothetical protein D1614_23180 [Maribellus luteus]